MPGYDYGNARLRAMKSRLLTRRELEALAEAGSLQGLIAELARSAYRKAVEMALARASGMDCIAEALRADLVNTVGKIRSFYDGREGERVAVALRSYDIHNLKAILRGLSKNAPAGEILATLLPVGELRYSTLFELARLRGPRAAIDLLASVGSPFARPLLDLRAEHPGAEIFEMELALERWHFREAQKLLEDEGRAGNLLAFALDFDLDLANVLTALRFAHAPAERSLLRERLGRDEVAGLLLGPGRLPFVRLAQASEQDNVEAAVETLAGTPFEPPLRAGLEAYARSGRLSDFERQLQRFRLGWMSAWMAKDPLGMGVVLGYLALKINEVSNLRWITQGVNLGLKPEAIRAELILGVAAPVERVAGVRERSEI